MLKKIIYYSIILLLLFRSFSPVVYVANADTNSSPTPTISASVSPTDSESETPTPTISATPSVSPTDTDIPTPSISISPIASATPSPVLSSSIIATLSVTPTIDPTNKDNVAVVDNSLNSGANSGDNTLKANPTIINSPTPSATVAAALTTGDSISVTNVDNTVNSNIVNSQIINQTLNFYFDTTGNIDLSVPEKIAAAIINSGNSSPVINVVITSNNTAVLENDINSNANTGDNTALGNGNISVNTGNAVSSVTLVNKVNFTVVNSIIHFVTINIFGVLNGNIILPNPTTLAPCPTCSINENTSSNSAVVVNNVNGSATSGENNVLASGSASLTTGNSASVISLNNLVNSNILDSVFGELYINDFGTWNGNFLGWGNLGSSNGGKSIVVFTPSVGTNGTSGSVDAQTTNNQALVINNVSSNANSGNNDINSSGNTVVRTGNAYSSICINNFINSTIVNGFGFFGCINIFGTLNGDIGGGSYFITPTPTQAPNNGGGGNNGGNNGGGSGTCTTTSLDITTSNNAGSYVNPGDTVTFFVNIKNSGAGPANNLILNLYLSLNGQNMGGATYNLPNIGSDQTLHLTTGLVLSNNAPGGFYTGNVSVTGNNCDGSNVSGSGNSTFNISGGNGIYGGSGSNSLGLFNGEKVLGRSAQILPSTPCGSCIWWPILLIETGALLIYNSFRLRRRRSNIILTLIPILTYILFLWINRTCLGLRFGIFPTSGSVYCRYFYLFDAGILGGYILILIKIRTRVVNWFSRKK